MAGQIIKRGERKWLIRVFLGRDPVTKKRKDFNQVIEGTKRDAERALRQVLANIDAGRDYSSDRMTLGTYLRKWLDTAAKPSVAPQTLDSYRDTLNRYVAQLDPVPDEETPRGRGRRRSTAEPPLGHVRLDRLTPLHIQEVYTNLAERLSPRTVRYVHSILRSALEQAVKWGLLLHNPADRTERPKLRRKTQLAVLDQAQARLFLEHARGTRWGVLFEVALATGMRIEETLGLPWRCVDWERSTILVEQVLVRRRSGPWHLGPPKTEKGRRSIIVPEQAMQSLRAHRKAQIEERLKAGPAYQNHELVFADQVGRPLYAQAITRLHFHPLLAAAGLPRIRLYDLRHTHATLLLLAGENAKVVAERLGHTGVRMTLDTYSHILPSMQAQASEKLRALLY